MRIDRQPTILVAMPDVTRILAAIDRGDPHAAAQLLPLVYDELRKLAAQKMAQEKPGQTLDATALVHEAYIRLVANPSPPPPPRCGEGDGGRGFWNSRGHFFAAAAEAMRRILIDNARRKQTEKHGGGVQRVELDHIEAATKARPEELLAIDDVLERLTQHNPVAGQLVKLRYFAEMSVEEAAEVLGLSRTQAYRLWSFVRAWMRVELAK